MTSLENLRSIWRVGCLMWRGRNTYCGLPDCADGEVDSGVIFRGLVQTPLSGVGRQQLPPAAARLDPTDRLSGNPGPLDIELTSAAPSPFDTLLIRRKA